MLGTLLTIGVLGGAGYVGWRLAKGGSVLRMNPADPYPWQEGFGGGKKMTKGKVIDTYMIALEVASDEQSPSQGASHNCAVEILVSAMQSPHLMESASGHWSRFVRSVALLFLALRRKPPGSLA